MGISDNSQHETTLITYWVHLIYVFAHKPTIAPHSFYHVFYKYCNDLHCTVGMLQPKVSPPSPNIVRTHTHVLEFHSVKCSKCGMC